MEARLTVRRYARSPFIAAAFAASMTPLPALSQPSDAVFEEQVANIKATMLSDPSRAIAMVEAIDRDRSTMGSPRRQATMKWLLGEGYSRTEQPKRAAVLLDEARLLIERSAPRSRLHADILLSEGGALNEAGQVGRALEDLQKAHELFREQREDRGQAKALILIALVHAAGNDNVSALRYFGQAIDVYDVDPGVSLAIHNGRGNALKELKRFDEAAVDYADALELARGLKSQLLIAQVLSNVARNELMAGQVKIADRPIAEGLRLTSLSEAASYRPVFIALAARAAMLRGDIDSAERLIDGRFRGVDLSTTILLDREAHDTAYRIYQQRGRAADALAHLTALKRLDDQATELARSNSAALAGARFDFANQELRITKLKADDLQKTVAFERDRSRSQLTMFAGAAAATLLLIMMLGIGLFTIRRSRNKLAVTNVALGKALAAKTEFLATTSHEIRTPLNGILGMTQVMLADRAMDGATRDRLSVVHGAGLTMRALVDDILDVAKLETGKMTIDAAPMDARATIADAARMWGEQARGKGLVYTVGLDDGPDWIVGDAARIRQIVFNLLSNAVKFTADGHVTLTTHIVGDRWRVSVGDSGIGIAAEHHEAIFESFRQADAGTTRQFGGTGLGLSICRSLSRAMDGDVTVDSELGAGALFTLDLPFVAATAPQRVAPDTADAGVLVVDRNPITRAMFRALFEPHSGTVTFADSVDDAVARIAAARPTTILLDAATVRAAGELTTAIAPIAALANDATIALLTPPLAPEEKAAVRAAGVTKVIEKPIGKEALIERLFGDEPSVSALVPEAA